MCAVENWALKIVSPKGRVRKRRVGADTLLGKEQLSTDVNANPKKAE